MNKVTQLGTILLDFIFPRDTHDILCDSLESERLEQLITQVSHERFPECILPLPYRHTLVRSAIYAMKYNGHKRAPVVLAQAIARTVIEELSEQRMFGAFHSPLLIPIPLHKTRFAERGFNQSERLLFALHEAVADTSIELDTTSLIRGKDTSTQVKSTTKIVRFKNMRHAFTVQSPENVHSKDILLLDDVLTTGATLMEAKKTLLDAGASRVLCIAVAH